MNDQNKPFTMSVSKAKTFGKCPLQFYFSYIEGIKIPPKAALIVGSATHKGLEDIYLNKMVEDKFNIDQALDTAAQYVQDADVNEEIDWDNPKEQVKDQAVDLVQTYINAKIPDTIHQDDIEGVEKYIKVNLGHGDIEVPVTGIIDLELKDKVIDFKTIKQTPKTIKPEDIFQCAFYTSEKNKSSIEVQYLVKLKTPKVVIPEPPIDIVTLRSLAQQMLIRNYIAIKSAMETGNFIPAGITHPWACGYCGYGEKGLCKYYKFKEVA